MDPVSIPLLESLCWYAHICVREKREHHLMCRSETLAAGKVECSQPYHVKHLENRGQGEKRKSHRYSKKKIKSVSLHWEPGSGDASWPKLAGSCPSKWQQLLAVQESMSQSEEKSDGIYINTTLMAHLALRRVPGCATDSEPFDRQSPAHQTRMACQMAGRRLRGAQICQTLWRRSHTGKGS